ncbi:glycosyltransferase [Agrobacterium tumefaciens]|uniref:glycosyltransferase family 2 protein n=1 Tax=Agrobacterium tumefaciens TaxID=358 RepID=UPI001574AE52|nr:glycosyltransferase [Agrobacterium tumefaciens]NTA83570.1 glycosyltransferase [Agrobacterium tumefaciens]
MLASKGGAQEGFIALADKPVMIRIKGRRIGKPYVCTVNLHRRDRVPEVVTRSLLIGMDGRGTFFGWMPVDLSSISVTTGKGSKMEQLPYQARQLSSIELIARLSFFSPRTVARALYLLAIGNIRGFQFRIVRLLDSMAEPSYLEWRDVHYRSEIRSDAADLAKTPKVLYSITGNGPLAEKTRKSLENQTYPYVCETPSPSSADAFENERDAIWIRLLAGMEFDSDAIARLIKPIADDDQISATYCDEDYFDAKSGHRKPFFKPAFNAPLAQSGWLAPDGAAIRVAALPTDLDLTSSSAGELLIAAARHGSIAHIPAPLLHRPTPRPPARVIAPPPLDRLCKVSVVIPTRDRADLMSMCLDGLFNKTSNTELDVIVIDNDSQDAKTLQLFERYEASGQIRRIQMRGPFNFAKACNLGVDAARQELILLLNNDVEPLHPEWLERMVTELEDKNVGACGALLLFPDGFIQHGGVTLGAGSVARHSFHFRHPQGGEDIGLISQRREVSAVTAACLLTRKQLWADVGGMNETALTVAFNDVDYCLKVSVQGKRIIWTPHACLTHLESVSRRADDTPEKKRRFAAEEKYMHEQWGPLLSNDPHYNPNLSLAGGDYVLDASPRKLHHRTPEAKRLLNP